MSRKRSREVQPLVHRERNMLKLKSLGIVNIVGLYNSYQAHNKYSFLTSWQWKGVDK